MQLGLTYQEFLDLDDATYIEMIEIRKAEIDRIDIWVSRIMYACIAPHMKKEWKGKPEDFRLTRRSEPPVKLTGEEWGRRIRAAAGGKKKGVKRKK